MVNDEPVLGQEHEVINISVYNNTLQTLKRHYLNTQGNFDHDIADFILKKGDYTNTYIAIETEGIPDGVTLKLVDENSHQLYSPVDANNNWITTACSITIGESDIIPLPAQFDAQLSSHIPFSAGIYNWKLKFYGNDYYEEKELPLNVEIRDFKVWDILTPQIYPNEDIQVKIKTYADTYYPFPNGTIEIDNHNPSISEYFTQGIGVLTTYATYDNSTGIITYPNQDITDLSIGKHTQVINQNSNCFIDYEVKNPIEFYYQGGTEYGTQYKIGYITKKESLVPNIGQYNPNIFINGQSIQTNQYGTTTSPNAVYNIYNTALPPGTYNCIVQSMEASNNQQYVCEGTFSVPIKNCSIILTSDINYIGADNNTSYTLVAQYQHNDTPIPNATIGFINEQGIVATTTTDSNGQAYYTNNQAGIYIAKVFDNNTNQILLESNTHKIYDVQYVSDININNEGNLLVDNYIGEYNTVELVNSISLQDDANLYVVKDINTNQNIIITDIDIDENGNLTYTSFGDI